MKALIVKKNSELVVEEVEKPQIAPNEALVKLISCGICGTDATLIKKKFKGITEEMYPITLGHEGVGEIVQVGKEYKKNKVGDIILLPFGTHTTSTNYPVLHSAWGAFSEYGVVEDIPNQIKDEEDSAAFAQLTIPASINKVEAPMIITFREIYSALLYFNIDKKETIVVYGSGPVAQVFVKLLSLMNVKHIVAIVRSEKKSNLMREFGAHQIINSTNENVIEEIRNMYPTGVKYVLDAVGQANIINEGMKLIKDRGEILCYGVPAVTSMTLDWEQAPYNWKLNFQQMPSKREEGQAHQQIIEWIENKQLKCAQFIGEIYSFEAIEQAFKDYLEKKTSKKIIIQF